MTSQIKLHPNNEVLEQYSLGQVSESQVEQIEEHLLVCGECQQELMLLEAYIQDVRRALIDLRREPQARRAGFWQRFLPIPGPVFAGACAALALAIVVPVASRQTQTLTPASVQLATSRGEAPDGMAQTQAGRPLHLTIRLAGLPPSPSYRAEIVDGANQMLWTGSPVRTSDSLTIDVSNGFAPGKYWVRLYDADGVAIHEFGLRLK